jgi:hypothetical protein
MYVQSASARSLAVPHAGRLVVGLLRLPHMLGLFIMVFAIIGCAGSTYDKARFVRMRSIIAGSTNKLLGVSLADASKLLSLDHARWDEGYSSVPLGQLRIYHFRGFYLLLDLEVLPRGMTPDQPQSFSSSSDSDLRSNGVWWVANFYPSLHIDSVKDPRKRMSNYWDGVQAGFRLRTDEARRFRSLTNR